ncbi:MAG: capsule assembly Wzi family protein [Tenuifilaceae bacterium]|jgi:hypothetical protein|nr:capsule assembly Wzi family protein [Tenuifilaceae bacterium]
MKQSTSLLILLLLSISLSAQSQTERVNADITLFSTLGASKDQSFWLTHNRYGIFDDKSANALALISGRLNMRQEKLFDIGGGVSLLGRASQSSTAYFHQAYIEAKVGFFNVEAGRKETIYGIPLGELSSGSVGISPNVMPVPRVTAIMPDFFPVPFTFGWLEIKGHFSHGWLNDERYAVNSFLHDKSAHVQTGGNTGLKIYWGIVHSAIWGGESPDHGKLPSSFSDFLRVVIAKEGASGSPSNEINALGFHTGLWDWGIKVDIGRIKVHAYYQHIFTDGSGMRYRNKLDGLWGIRVQDPFPAKWVNQLTYEVLYTKNQSGMGVSDKGYGDISPYCDVPNCGFSYGGRDNYYNNSIYRSGYSYYGMSMGNPFFLTNNTLRKFHPDAKTFDTRFFISTRNIAHHLGIGGEIKENLSYRFLGSFVKYYGSYAGLNLGETWGFFNPDKDPEEYFFNPAIKQWYFMLETQWQVKKVDRLRLTTTFATDFGDMFNSTGFMLGAKWEFSGKN